MKNPSNKTSRPHTAIKQKQSEQKVKIKEPAYKYANVLLVDDDELDNFINIKVIEANYFSRKVHTLTSGVAALGYLSNRGYLSRGPLENYPEVIFIDIRMPIIDGFQFIEELLDIPEIQQKKPKLVILTSSLSPEDRQRALALKPDIIFLNKPLTKEMLGGI